VIGYQAARASSSLRLSALALGTNLGFVTTHVHWKQRAASVFHSFSFSSMAQISHFTAALL